MKRTGQGTWTTAATLAAAIAAVLLGCTLASAAPPPGKGGGGGDGGAAFTIVPFRPSEMATTHSYVDDLNDAGQAVGMVRLESGEDRAVHLDIASDTYTLLNGGSHANGVNNLNQTVGHLNDGQVTAGLFWKSPSATPVPLPPLPDHDNSGPLAINDAGLIVGHSWRASETSPMWTGVIWRAVVNASGEVSVQGPLPFVPLAGDMETAPSDMTELAGGQALVAGGSVDSLLYASTAVVWLVKVDDEGALLPPDPPVSLGSLGLETPSFSITYSINSYGDSCGLSDNWPVVAPAGQGVEALEGVRKADRGRAYAINDAGDIVGELNIIEQRWLTYNPRAYLWTNGSPIRLESQLPGNSGWTGLWSATSINNAGVIAGTGNYDVNQRGFLMIPNK